LRTPKSYAASADRRFFIRAVAAALLAAPGIIFGQPKPKVSRIAIISDFTPENFRSAVDEFKEAFRKFGYTDGVNYLIEEYRADSELAIPALVQKVVASRPDVILTISPRAAIAAKKATNSIPIVFRSSGDPVGWGLVESLSHPGGNVTGSSNLLHETAPKQLDLLHEAFPKATKVAVLMDPVQVSHRAALASIQARAPSIGVNVLEVKTGSQQEIERAFELVARQKAQALLVLPTGADERFEQIDKLVQRARLPTVGAGTGAVLDYGARMEEMTQRSAELVHMILQGAKPADLPVVQPTRFELTVNLKAARAIGVKIPQSLLIRADRVLE
jgi:putative ABC transport system substrate-binding protein